MTPDQHPLLQAASLHPIKGGGYYSPESPPVDCAKPGLKILPTCQQYQQDDWEDNSNKLQRTVAFKYAQRRTKVAEEIPMKLMCDKEKKSYKSIYHKRKVGSSFSAPQHLSLTFSYYDSCSLVNRDPSFLHNIFFYLTVGCFVWYVILCGIASVGCMGAQMKIPFQYFSIGFFFIQSQMLYSIDHDQESRSPMYLMIVAEVSCHQQLWASTVEGPHVERLQRLLLVHPICSW